MKYSYFVPVVISAFAAIGCVEQVQVPVGNKTESLPSYAWQSECGLVCENALGKNRLLFIDGQTCETLPSMYELKRTENQEYWYASISDKAISIGCSGFPKK